MQTCVEFAMACCIIFEYLFAYLPKTKNTARSGIPNPVLVSVRLGEEEY